VAVAVDAAVPVPVSIAALLIVNADRSAKCPVTGQTNAFAKSGLYGFIGSWEFESRMYPLH
jgi:hypothetical protein